MSNFFVPKFLQIINFNKKAASILRVGGLKYWIGRSWSAGYLTKGLNALKAVAREFVFTPFVASRNLNQPIQTVRALEIGEDQHANTPLLVTPASGNFLGFFNEEFANNHEAEIEIANFENFINNEINLFKTFVQSQHFINSTMSTKEFWTTNIRQFHFLSLLTQILLTILSSSAFIERYFSICGITSDKYPNMDDDLFEMRCMLKANIDVLNQMSTEI